MKIVQNGIRNYLYLTFKFILVIIMSNGDAEEKQKRVAKRALEKAEDTGDQATVNEQRKANKKATGYEGDE